MSKLSRQVERHGLAAQVAALTKELRATQRIAQANDTLKQIYMKGREDAIAEITIAKTLAVPPPTKEAPDELG